MAGVGWGWGDRLNRPPSSGLPLSRDCIPGLPSVGLARSQAILLQTGPSASGAWAAAWAAPSPSRSYRHLPPPQVCRSGPTRARASTAGLRWGLERSGCCT